MKPLRVGDATYAVSHLHCLACGRPERSHVVGVVSLVCQGKRCRRAWEAVRLPPGTTGAQLLDLYGETVARAIHRVACPSADPCSADALAAWVLPISATEAMYLQRMADSPEPAVGWHRAGTMLRTLLGVA